MSVSTTNLEAAKKILEQPADDLGDYEIAEATARALVGVGELLGEVVQLLRPGGLGRISVEVLAE